MKKPIDELLRELLEKSAVNQTDTVTISFDSKQEPIQADEYILIYKAPNDEKRICIHNHSSLSFIESIIDNEILEQHATRHTLHSFANNLRELFS